MRDSRSSSDKSVTPPTTQAAHSVIDRRPVLIANPGADLYGSDRMVLETVSGLVSSGERVVVTVPETGPLIAELGRRGAAVAIIPTPILRKSALRPLGMLKLMKDALTALIPGIMLLRRLKPKIMLVNTITPPLWFVLARAARVPVICHVHEGEASTHPLIRKVIGLPLLLSSRLIANSRFSLDVFASALPALRDRSTIIYNAVACPVDTPPPRATLSIPVRLVYVGRLSRRKGPDVAVRAVELLVHRGVDVTLDLVGAVFPGYEWFEEQLRERIATGRLSTRIRLHGFQPDVWPYVAASDISIIPSTTDEPFGNTVVEAALAARPSIVSHTSGLIEASSGFRSATHVSPGSAEEIADAVEMIIAGWPTYAQAAMEDASRARDRYGQDRYRKSINEILAEVAA